MAKTEKITGTGMAFISPSFVYLNLEINYVDS